MIGRSPGANRLTNPLLGSRFQRDRPATKATAELTGYPQKGLPLALALEWARAHGKTLEQERDGEAMFWALMRGMENP